MIQPWVPQRILGKADEQRELRYETSKLGRSRRLKLVGDCYLGERSSLLRADYHLDANDEQNHEKSVLSLHL